MKPRRHGKRKMRNQPSFAHNCLRTILKQNDKLIHKIIRTLNVEWIEVSVSWGIYRMRMALHAWHRRLAQSLDRFPGFRFVRPDEVSACWQLVNRTVNSNIAPLSIVSAVHETHQNAIAIFGTIDSQLKPDVSSMEVKCVAFFLFLNARGAHALSTCGFNGTAINPAWLCPPDGIPQASYTWSIASKDQYSGFRLARLCQHLSDKVFSDIDQYARVTTPGGQRLVRLIGYELLEDSRSDSTGTLFIRKRTH